MNRRRFLIRSASVLGAVLAVWAVNSCTASKPPVLTHPVWTNYELNRSVFAMAFEGNDLWVGTEQGLIKYDLTADRIVARYDSKTGLGSDIITTVKIDSHGNKWVGTHGGGLAKFDGKAWRRFNVPDLADPYVYDILFDREGRMWVANWKGVSIFDGTRWKSLTKADGIIDDWVYALAMDRDGVIWLGTEGGVTRYDGRQFVSYTHKEGVGADIKTIGSYEKIANPSFHHRTTPGKEAEGYNPNYILAAAVDSRNNKWFGTWGAGLSRFDGKTWTTYTTRDGLSGNFISDILVDRDDMLYVATEGGVSLLSQNLPAGQAGSWKKLTAQDGLVDDGVFAVVSDALGFKWFGTLKGISKLVGYSAL